ncbi:MAG TPA: DUF927 domain-containing protein [Bacteroidales bacterium]|nr:DUF927 domain-containing protein [Bacteroidales bacterium]
MPFEIEKLTRETILERDVFDYLFTIINHVQHTEILVQLRSKARKLGVARDFDTLYKANQLVFIQKNKQAGSNVIEFTDCPLPGLKCGKWECTDLGVHKEIINNFVPQKVTACQHPILPVERLSNLDDGTEKIKIAFYKDGYWKDFVVNRSMVANKSNIIQLADRGIEVTSENAKDLVAYISDVVTLNMGDIPVHKSIGRLGWIEDDFAPYVDGVKYDGDLAYKDMYDAVSECGDYEKWKDEMVQLRKNKIFRLLMASSFASPLVERLGILPFIIHIWGGTGAGKTVGIMAAMSVWGNPEMGKLVRSMNATQVSLGRTASFLHSVPFAGDELQIIKSRWENFDQLIMFITEGIDRGRGKAYGGIEELKQWKCCFLFSGEEPITKDGSGGGAKNRVIEIEATENIVDDGNDIANFVRENYGYAGKDYIANLPDRKELQDRYREIFKKVLEECDTTEKQAMAMSAILLADELSCKIIFRDVPLKISDIKDYLRSKTDVDVPTRAYEWVISWIARNTNRFIEQDNNGEIWGKLDLDNNNCLVLKDVLTEQMSKAGFEYPAVVRKWAENGYIERNSQGRYYFNTHVYGIKGNYVKIVFNNEDNIVDENLETLPF